MSDLAPEKRILTLEKWRDAALSQPAGTSEW